MQKNMSIQKLYLDENNFEGRGIHAIVNFLHENNQCFLLSLNKCEINYLLN